MDVSEAGNSGEAVIPLDDAGFAYFARHRHGRWDGRRKASIVAGSFVLCRRASETDHPLVDLQ